MAEMLTSHQTNLVIRVAILQRNSVFHIFIIYNPDHITLTESTCFLGNLL